MACGHCKTPSRNSRARLIRAGGAGGDGGAGGPADRHRAQAALPPTPGGKTPPVVVGDPPERLRHPICSGAGATATILAVCRRAAAAALPIAISAMLRRA
jgi:hypothetical protein